jgi:hypothetical protein
LLSTKHVSTSTGAVNILCQKQRAFAAAKKAVSPTYFIFCFCFCFYFPFFSRVFGRFATTSNKATRNTA